MNQKNMVLGVLFLVVGLGAGYAAGNSAGHKSGYNAGDSAGYKRAEADIQKLEQGAAQKAVDEAAKAANPFQVSNPLEGVETNPFEKAKKVLNPFE